MLAEPPGAPAYEELRKQASRITLGSRPVLIASIDDLVAMKLKAGRPIDLADVEALDAIRRLSR